MNDFNILTRRAFLDRSVKLGLGVALSTLVDIPFVMKRALAEGNIGLNNQKILFIFLRGANDALNSVIPIEDSGYNTDINPATQTVIRPNIAIPKDAISYASTGACDFPNHPLYGYNFAIRLGNSAYPHMKLRLSRPPADPDYLFLVDSHDGFLTAPPDSADRAALEQLKRHNAALAETIAAAWTQAGLPTERNYLRRKIRQARERKG